jgi:hypothetical protein
VTIASVSDFQAARRIKAKLNGYDLGMDGRIDALEVHQRAAGAARCLANIPLRHHSFFA